MHSIRNLEVMEYDEADEVSSNAMNTTAHLLGNTTSDNLGDDSSRVTATTTVKVANALNSGTIKDGPKSATLREAVSRSQLYTISTHDDKFNIRQEGRWFKDEQGRVCLLRGVNLSGATKTPSAPLQYSHIEDGFFNHREMSFVGRPFPLDEADVHLMRLKRWGFNFLRFLVTWEAIEHAGPGIYDEEYIDYVVAVLQKAKFHGFKVFVDPHQDVWSRFSGGSGAPGWTLEVVGLDMTKFNETEAAIVQNTFRGPKQQYPKMVWATNYQKLAAATMFTLFFAGKAFAPNFIVEGQNIQDYLQSHYIKAIQRVAMKVKSLGVVVGYDTLNEPSSGYLGHKDIRTQWAMEYKVGLSPTPLETMLLGSGFSLEIDEFRFTKVGAVKNSRSVLVNPSKVSCWLPGRTCVWAQHGVYDLKTGECLKPNYFAMKTPDSDIEMDYVEHYWKPFAVRYGKALREIHADAIIFLEPPVNDPPPRFKTIDPSKQGEEPEGEIAGPLCYAPHWYDGLTLTSKNFSTLLNIDFVGYTRKHYSTAVAALHWGETSIRRCFARMHRVIKQEGLDLVGEYPCLIGEIGIPYDMNGKEAYRTGDYSKQVKALDFSLSAIDANLLSATIWTYVSDNCHEWGDNWNGEDLSIWSPDDIDKNSDAIPNNSTVSLLTTGKYSSGQAYAIHNPEDLDSGGRALDGVVRPFARRICGVPTMMQFSMLPSTDKPNKKTFVLEYVDQTGKAASEGSETEIYLPLRHFPLSPGTIASTSVSIKPNAVSPGGVTTDNLKSAAPKRTSRASSSNSIVNASDSDSPWTVHIQVSDGTFTYNEEDQVLLYRHGSTGYKGIPGLHRISVTAAKKKTGCC